MNVKLAISRLAAVLVVVASSACNGEETEKWAIKRASGPGDTVIVKPNSTGEFRLKPEKKAGKVVYYRVEFDAGKMTDNWKDVILFPRGSAQFPAWPQTAQLEPYTPAQATDYEVKIKKALEAEAPFTQAPNTNTQRLEGDVQVKKANGTTKKEALTLYFINGAVKDNSRLLIVQLRDTEGGSVQDGSGSGNPNN